MNEMAKQMAILGISPQTTREEFERSCQFLVLAYHPDRFDEPWKEEATRRLRLILWARTNLRKVYASSIPPAPSSGTGQQEYFAPGF